MVNAELDEMKLAAEAWEVMETKIRALTTTQLHEWTDMGSVCRGQDCCDHVLSVGHVDGTLVGKIKGTKPYVTNVGLDESGEMTGFCTCPIGVRCKHAVALLLVAQQKLAAGEVINSVSNPAEWTVSPESVRERLELRGIRKSPPPPPPPPSLPRVRRIEVNENPFGLWTPSGSRGGKSFSFRTADGICFWDIVVASFVFLLAKGSLDSPLCRISWWSAEADEELSDPELFTCSCGERRCDGFGDESCEMTRTTVILRIERNGEIFELVFSRVKFEYWVMLMLWQMQGSQRLRVDPWNSLTEEEGYRLAVNCLLLARPRCRAMWERMRSGRRFAEADFEEFEAQSPDEGAMSLDGRSVLEFFSNAFSTRSVADFSDERRIACDCETVDRQMEEQSISRGELFAYVSMVGVRKEAVELFRGDELDIVREGNGKDRPWRIRVDSITRQKTIGYLNKQSGLWVAEMMERHGMRVRGRTLPFDWYDKSLPLRLDFSFVNPWDGRFCWGEDLGTRSRFYFEMLRTVALHVQRYPAAFIKKELENLGWGFREVKKEAEIAFLLAVVSSAAREIEYHLTREEVARRREYCDSVRRSLHCEAAGKMLVVGGFRVLPLKATCAEATPLTGNDLNEVAIWVRLSWEPETKPRPEVELPDFPIEATGFAVFRGSEMIDLCLVGVPVGELKLFMNMGVYDGYFERGEDVDEAVAIERVKTFLATLPIKNPSEYGDFSYFGFERGIEAGKYKISEAGRLVFLRFIMLGARRHWVL